MSKVAVIGAYGRMGSETCRAIEGRDGMELVARIGRSDALDAVRDADVAVEFSTPRSVLGNTRFCIESGIPTVVGATGLGSDELEELGTLAAERRIGVLVAPNFALGAVLMMRFAQQAARFYDKAEIIERHHEAKLDAPSGTSVRTAALMGKDVPIHSLRLPGSVAHQEVIFGGAGETLTIRHDSLDRTSFMPGVLRAIEQVSSLDGLVVGLENLLDLK